MSFGHRDHFGRDDRHRSAAAARTRHVAQGQRQPRDARDVRDWVQVVAAELARLPAVERKTKGGPKR